MRSILYLALIASTYLVFSQTSEVKDRLDQQLKDALEVYYSDPSGSLSKAQRIVDESRLISYKHGELEGLRLVANSHFLLGRLDSTLFYLAKAIDIAENCIDISAQSDILLNISQTYDKMELYEISADYLKSALDLRRKTNNPERLAVVLMNYGYHEYLRKNYDTALKYLQEAKEITDTLPRSMNHSFLYNEIGAVYLELDRIDDAIKMIKESIMLAKQYDNHYDQTFGYTLLADAMIRTGDYAKAHQNIDQAIETASSAGITLDNNVIYEKLSEIYRLTNRPEEALLYKDKSQHYKDSLNELLAVQKIGAFNVYQEQKQAQIKFLEMSNQSLQQEILLSQQRSIIINVVIALFAVLLAFVALYFKNKRIVNANKEISKQKEELVQLNVTKTKLFGMVSHDIKNPLNNLNGMLKLAQENLITPEEFADFASSVQDQTLKLSSMSEMLITWAKSHGTGLDVKANPIDFTSTVQNCIDYLRPLAREKKIQVEFNALPIWVLADKQMVTLIVNNIINNAIKFTPIQGVMSISIRDNHDFAELEISDNGVGMTDDQIDNLFKSGVKSTSGTNAETGTGIGLLLSYDLVKLNNGYMRVTSKSGVGSSFYISLPSYSKQITERIELNSLLA